MRPSAVVRRRLILFAASLAFVLATPSHSYAAFPGENGGFVFTYEVDFAFGAGTYVATTSNATASDFTTLTHCPQSTEFCTNDWGDWSPNGRRLVYVRQSCDTCALKIVTSRPNGSDRRVLFQVAGATNLLWAPVWSPSGRWIAFSWIRSYFRAGSYSRADDIYVIRTNGRHLTRITHTPGLPETGLDWSSRNRIAFTRWANGGGWRSSDLFTMRPDGTRVRRLTNNNGVAEMEPEWGPGGRNITFVRGQNFFVPREFEIWRMGALGRNREKLSESGEGPAWAPDGSWIAYVSRPDHAIHIVRPWGGGDVVVGSPRRVMARLDWRPL
jgi:Tol biopolymer transport system component